MITHFAPQVTRLESVQYARDWAELAGHWGPRTRLRVWQEGVAREVAPSRSAATLSEAEVGARLEAAGVDVGSVCDVELWTPPLFFTRHGMPVTGLEGSYGPGGTVFLCLNGPSFDEGTRALLAGRPGVVTFCVNNGAHTFRPDLWACVDAPERFMSSIWSDRRVLKFVPWERLTGDARVYVFHRNDAFDAARFLTEDTINWGNHQKRGGGRSVMLVALRIAWELGFRRVVLVGCDFHMSATHRYWFPEQRSERAIRNNLTSYEIMTGYFRALRPVFDAAGFAVVNATRGSRLTVFPMTDLGRELEAATVDTSASTEGMYVPARARR